MGQNAYLVGEWDKILGFNVIKEGRLISVVRRTRKNISAMFSSVIVFLFLLHCLRNSVKLIKYLD